MLELLPIVFCALWLVGFVLTEIEHERLIDEARRIDREAREKWTASKT